MLNTIPENLINECLEVWRADAEQELTTWERLAELTELPTKPGMADVARRQADRLRAMLAGEELDAYMTGYERADQRRVEEMPPARVRREVESWSFDELTGLQALIADALRDLRAAGPGYGFRWRRRLIDRYCQIAR
jgi:hypothetical protein